MDLYHENCLRGLEMASEDQIPHDDHLDFHENLVWDLALDLLEVLVVSLRKRVSALLVAEPQADDDLGEWLKEIKFLMTIIRAYYFQSLKGNYKNYSCVPITQASAIK